jgi:hypothetical protein
MNELHKQLEEIEISLQEAKEAIAMASALQRLHNNADFQKVILDGFFRTESYRSVMLKADINFQSPENQKQVDDVITGIGQLGQYFRKLFIFGENAQNSLDADSHTREELLQEEAASDDDMVN